jgi:ubiquinone/menaquinone biosynthesis C-methylase UbiE
MPSSALKPWRNLRAGARIVLGRLVNRIPEAIWLRLLQIRWQGHSAHGSPAALRALLTEAQGLAGYIDQEAIRYDRGLHVKHRLTRYHDFFVHRIHPGERVLDVGCGIGAVAYDVADKAGAWVVGIDLDPVNIALARERFPHLRVEHLQGDALVCLPPEAFDVVILSNILEHLPDRPEFLNELVTVTKSKRLLIRVPLFEREWQVPLRQELGLEWRSDTTHETEYTLESFASEIATAHLLISHQEVRWGEIWAEVRTE